MKILMLTPYLPYPPSAGGQIRSYNLIKHLSKKHDITLACFTRETNTPDQITHMEQFCRKVLVFKRGKAWTLPNIIRTGLSPYPFLVMIYFSSDVKSAIEKELENGHYDLIHAETFYVMPHLPRTTIPTVLVEQTVMSGVFAHQVKTDPRWWLKPILYLDIAKMRYWETYYWKKANRTIAVSHEDASIIESRAPGIKVDVVPNGVGDDFEELPHEIHFNKTILYMGNYKWMQNWEAAQILATQVFPIIKQKVPDATLKIAGQFPTANLKNLETPDIKIIELKDTDKQGVVDAYTQSGVLVAPIYGPSGTRLKILAAMAAMTPVVTTPIGAEGVGIVDGISAFIGKTPVQLAEKTIEILQKPHVYTKIAQNARKIVSTGYTWEKITGDLSRIYEEMTK